MQIYYGVVNCRYSFILDAFFLLEHLLETLGILWKTNGNFFLLIDDSR